MANRVGGAEGAFESDENEVQILGPGGFAQPVPRASKREVAGRILDEVLGRLKAGTWQLARSTTVQGP